MPTLGEEIKRRREERNISLNEVSESTRISVRFLKAIEADNFAVLPGGIFTRSFIRSYAKEVGLNEEEAMSLYNQHLASQQAAEQQAAEQEALSGRPRKSSSNNVSILQPEAPTLQPKPPKQKNKQSVYTPETNWSRVLIGVGIIVLLAILVTVIVRQLNKAQANKDEQARNAAQQKATEQEMPNTATSPSPTPGQSTPGSTTAPSTTPTEATTPPVNSSDDLRVKLEASTGDCWVRFQADDAPAEQTIIKQGQSQDVPPAKSAVKVTYGNRQSLKVIINNREATLPETLPKFKGQIIISRDTLPTFFQPQAVTPQ